MSKSPPDWLSKLRGRFLVFDGPDGSGKSTQFKRFTEFAKCHGIAICSVREPGGTSIGEQIRRVLLDPANDQMDRYCEVLLYMASRAELVAQQIRPALQQQQLVVADRFISSTLAYQGSAGGIPLADILRLGHMVLSECWPDLVIIFDVAPDVAGRRLHGKKHSDMRQPMLFSDRIERQGVAYERAVRRGYLEQAKAEPDRYLVIDASGDTDTVFAGLCNALTERVDVLGGGGKASRQLED